MAGKRSKTADDFGQEWRAAVNQRAGKVGAKSKKVGMVRNEKQNLAGPSKLRDAVLHYEKLGMTALGKHYNPSLIAIPLSHLLRALDEDECL